MCKHFVLPFSNPSISQKLFPEFISKVNHHTGMKCSGFPKICSYLNCTYNHFDSKMQCQVTTIN